MKKFFKNKATIIVCCLVLLVCGMICAQAAIPVGENAWADNTYNENVKFSLLDGQNPSNADEGYAKVYDNDDTSKYCIQIGQNPYVVFRANAKGTVVSGYKFTTGNDTASHEGRNPKDWTLYACNDYDATSKTGTWTAIHTVSGDTTMGAANKTAYDFSFSNDTAYEYYKFSFTARRGADSDNTGTYVDSNIQLSEIDFAASVDYAKSGTIATSGVTFAVRDGRRGNTDDNTYTNLFDKNLGSKYCVSVTATSSTGEHLYPYVVAEASKPVVITRYSLYTANDTASYSVRNPKDWTLYGSNDYNTTSKSGTWTAVHTVSGDTTMGATSYTPYNFYVNEKPASYTFFKFEFTARQGDTDAAGNLMQIAEIAIECAPTPVADGDLKVFYTYKGKSSSPANTSYEMLHDDNPDTDYSLMMNYNPWVAFHSTSRTMKESGTYDDNFSTARVVAAYYFRTSNDAATYPDRNPADWIFYGSNDNKNWTEIDNVKGVDLGAVNSKWFGFPTDNTVAYQFYKFEFKKTKGGSDTGVLSLADIQFVSYADANPVITPHFVAHTAQFSSSAYTANTSDHTLSHQNLYDGDRDTKYLVNFTGDSYISVKSSIQLYPNPNKYYQMIGYRFVLAADYNSHPERIPTEWSVSNDGISDSITLASGKKISDREYEFYFAAPDKFVSMMSFEFTKNKGALDANRNVTTSDELSLAEIEFIVVPLCEHTWGTTYTAEVPATCSTTGVREHMNCTKDCGAYKYKDDSGAEQVCLKYQYESKVVIPKNSDHSYGNWTDALDPACTTEGHYKYRQCSRCNVYEYEKDGSSHTCAADEFDTEIKREATGHTFNNWVDFQEYKCATVDGHWAYRQCLTSGCGTYQYIDVDDVSDPAAYATDHPSSVKSCASTEYDTKIKKAVEHTWSTTEIIAEVPATCSSTGEKAHWHCANCNNNYDTDQSTELDSLTIAINPSAHTYGEWTNAAAPDCTQAGNLKYRQCSGCNQYEYVDGDGETQTCLSTEYADKIQLAAKHDFGAWGPFKNYTCTEDGNHEWKQCYRCNGYEYKIEENTYFCAKNEFDTKVKLPKHHTWGTFVQGSAPTCAETGSRAYRPCIATGCGRYQYTVSAYTVADDYFNTTTDTLCVTTSAGDLTVAKLSHDWTSEVSSKTPSCTEYGNYAYRTCDRGCNQYKYNISGVEYFCSATEENFNQYIRRDKTPHKYGTLIAEAPATCKSTGMAAHYECSDCHNLFDENYVQKTSADLILAIDPDNHTFATSCSKRCSNTGCSYERPDSERVHVFDTDGNACLYGSVTAQHAYRCTNANCPDGVMYEGHTMVLVCGQTGTGNAWQHWEKCSKEGCPHETTKTTCTIKYECKDATNHVMYCQIGDERHELGANGEEKVGSHSGNWTTYYVFEQAKYDAGEGSYHSKQCKLCHAFSTTNEAACTIAYDDNTDNHWQECTVCGKKHSAEEAHTYGMVFDAECHWEECTVCEKYKSNSNCDHVFESETSTSCSEEGCGYQRFLTADVTINGYEIDAPVGGITASATTDRTDTNLTLIKYSLFDSSFSRIDFENNLKDSAMTFRPETAYYAIFYFDCGQVYPSNDIKPSDFTIPEKFEYGYYDFEVDASTGNVRLELLVTLLALGGVSAEKSVSEMVVDLKNFEVGKVFGDVVIDITSKDLTEGKSFSIISPDFSTADGSTIYDDMAIASNVLYSLILSVDAPDGFNFYGITDSDITVKNDMGIVYLMPMTMGKSAGNVNSRDGKRIQLSVAINGFVAEHVCGEDGEGGEDGWEIVEAEYDYFCPDITLQHTRMCKTCGAVEFVNHVYEDYMDAICDDCGYHRTLCLDKMHFTITGYQADALLRKIMVKYSGTFTGIGDLTEPEIFDIDDMSASIPYDAKFVPGKAYGLMLTLNVPEVIDVYNCIIDNVYVNGTKVKVVMGIQLDTRVMYALELPAVTGDSTQTRIEGVELKTDGFVLGSNLRDVSFKVDHDGIAKFTTQVEQNDGNMSDSQSFALGNKYILIVTYTLEDGYYGTGVTADDLKVTLYDDLGADTPTKIGVFECIDFAVEDFGIYNEKRTISCAYLVQLVVPEDTEGHEEGHVYPTENPSYHTDDAKHYVMCGCGAYNTEGQAHVYGEEGDFFQCTVCGYERVYYVEKIAVEIDWHVGIDDLGILSGAQIFVDDIQTVDNAENSSFEWPLSIETAILYEGIIHNFGPVIKAEPARAALACKTYSLMLGFICYNDYCDVSALTQDDYILKGVGETDITSSYLLRLDMDYDVSMIVVLFTIPPMEVNHVHGGTWIDEVPATCLDTGTKGHYVCTICGDDFDADDVKIDDLTINALGHDYGTVSYVWSGDNSECTATHVCSHDSTHVETETVTSTSSVTQNKTCLLDELTTYTATFSNAAFAQQVKADVKTADALGHDGEGVISHVDAKCEETGVVGGIYCTRCEDGKAAAEATINALGHDCGDWIAEVPATCVATGVAGHKDCAVCHKHFGAEDNELTDLTLPIDPAHHSALVLVAATIATTEREGNIAYYHCEGCGKYYSDETASIEISAESMVVPKLIPEIIEGQNSEWSEKESDEDLAFKSNIQTEDIKGIYIDGERVADEYYEIDEITYEISIKKSYLSTLPSGEHEISVVSDSGNATTLFSVAPDSSLSAGAWVGIAIAIAIVVGGAVALIVLGAKGKLNNLFRHRAHSGTGDKSTD